MKINIPYFIGLIVAGVSVAALLCLFDAGAAALGLVVYAGACIQTIGQE